MSWFPSDLPDFAPNMENDGDVQEIKNSILSGTNLNANTLDAALKYHLFTDAIQLMKLGVSSPNSAVHLLNYVQTPYNDPNFIPACLISILDGADFSSILNNLMSVHPSKITEGILLISTVLAPLETKQKIDISDLLDESIASYITLWQRIRRPCVSYQAILTILTALSNKAKNMSLRANELRSDFLDKKEKQKIEKAIQNIQKNLAGITAHSAQEFIDCIDSPLSRIERIVNKIAPRFLDNKRKEMFAQFLERDLKSIQNDTHFIMSEFVATFKLIDAQPTLTKIREFLTNSPNISIYGYLELAHLISAIKSNNPEVFQAFESSIPKISARLPKEISAYPFLTSPPLEISKSESSHLMLQLNDFLQTLIYFAECGRLEAIFSAEIVCSCSHVIAYPEKISGIFERYVKSNALTTKLVENLEQWNTTWQDLYNRISKFKQECRLVPGLEGDILITKGFKPAMEWKWLEIPHIKYPETPWDVRELLYIKDQILLKAKEFEESEHVIRCSNCLISEATVICPECSKLVLCEPCAQDLGECPFCSYLFPQMQ